MASVLFNNIDEQSIRKAFLKAYNQYDLLQSRKVILTQVNLRKTTMQAQPVISIRAVFTGKLTYKIKLAKHVRNSETLLIKNLPEEVLTGWFAHELGHIQDYISRKPWQMIGYGIRYLFSSNFRRKAEHQADKFAIQHGFAEELIAVKRFVFDHDLIEEGYKDQMRKYYMSVEDVQTCVQLQASFTPTVSEI